MDELKSTLQAYGPITTALEEVCFHPYEPRINFVGKSPRDKKIWCDLLELLLDIEGSSKLRYKDMSITLPNLVFRVLRYIERLSLDEDKSWEWNRDILWQYIVALELIVRLRESLRYRQIRLRTESVQLVEFVLV